MADTIRRLPDAELAVMQAVWACKSPAKRAQIEELLQETRPMAATTLLTLLSRLAEKGFLAITKDGRSAVYTPLVQQADYLAQQSRRFLDTLCGGRVDAFAAALCGGSLTKDELRQLRALLERNAL